MLVHCTMGVFYDWPDMPDDNVTGHLVLVCRIVLSSIVFREVVSTFGAMPSNTLASWHKQNFTKPVPIKMDFVPIVELFTEQNIAYMSKMTGICMLLHHCL